VLAILWAVVVLFALRSENLPSAVLKSPLSLVLAITLAGAFVCSGVVIEVLRKLVPSWALWSDAAHIRAVLLTFVLLGTVQCAGVMLALSAFSLPEAPK
jgi:hypothetical protein